MADGNAWEDLAPELEGPGVGIRRMDAGGLLRGQRDPHETGAATRRAAMASALSQSE